MPCPKCKEEKEVRGIMGSGISISQHRKWIAHRDAISAWVKEQMGEVK